MHSVVLSHLHTKTGEEISIRLRDPAILMARVFRNYCRQYGIRATSARFLGDDGAMIDGRQTFEEVAEGYHQNKDTNIVLVRADCLLEQTGGRGRIYWR